MPLSLPLSSPTKPIGSLGHHPGIDSCSPPALLPPHLWVCQDSSGLTALPAPALAPLPGTLSRAPESPSRPLPPGPSRGPHLTPLTTGGLEASTTQLPIAFNLPRLPPSALLVCLQQGPSPRGWLSPPPGALFPGGCLTSPSLCPAALLPRRPRSPSRGKHTLPPALLPPPPSPLFLFTTFSPMPRVLHLLLWFISLFCFFVFLY